MSLQGAAPAGAAHSSKRAHVGRMFFPTRAPPEGSTATTSRVTRGIEQLGAIFEMHGVEMVPPAAPDEALGLEGVDDRLRHAVLPAALLPAPVVAERGI